MMNMTRRRPPVPQMLPQSQRSAPPPAAAQVTASPAMSNPANLPQIQRRKKFLAEQLMQSQQGDGPDSVVEGLADLGSTAIQGYFLNKVSDQEQEARAQTNDAFKRALASALQGGDATGLFTDGSYDNLDPGQQAIANALLERQFAGKDKPQRYEVGGNLVDENGSVIYQGPQELKPNPTRQIGRNGQIIDQEFVGGQWKDIGSRAQFAQHEPKEPRQPNIITLYGPDGKPKSLYDTDPAVSGMLASGWTEAAPKSNQANPPSAADLRGEYGKITKDYGEALNGYNKVVASVQDPSPAGDVALIFGFMKTLDPGSTVREGEFATAQQTGGLPAQVVSMYNRILSGERLTPQQRADFARTAANQFKTYQDRKALADQFYSGLASRAGVAPGDVLVPYPQVQQIPPQSAVADAGGLRNGTADSTPQPKSKAEYDALPRGTVYIDLQGRKKVKQ